MVACTPPVVNSPFIETVAENESSVGYVAEIHDVEGSVEADRYVPIRPRADSVVDSVGDLNTVANAVWLWDAACLSRAQVTGNFAENGGTIFIKPDGSVSFVAGRLARLDPTEVDTARASCPEAAADLESRGNPLLELPSPTP